MTPHRMLSRRLGIYTPTPPLCLLHLPSVSTTRTGRAACTLLRRLRPSLCSFQASRVWKNLLTTKLPTRCCPRIISIVLRRTAHATTVLLNIAARHSALQRCKHWFGNQGSIVAMTATRTMQDSKKKSCAKIVVPLVRQSATEREILPERSGRSVACASSVTDLISPDFSGASCVTDFRGFERRQNGRRGSVVRGESTPPTRCEEDGTS